MQLSSSLRNRPTAQPQTRRTPGRKPTSRFHPRLEVLDERALPGFLSPAIYPTNLGPDSAVTADVNGDGKLDLITANYASQSISVLLGKGNGTFQAAKNYSAFVGTDSSAPAVGDINGDRKLDILTGGSLLLGNGDGTFQAAQSIRLGSKFAVGDFNGDKQLDVAVAVTGDMGIADVVLWLNNGKRNVGFNYGGQYAIPSGEPSAIVAGNINNDGYSDLIVAGGRYGYGSGPGSGYYSVLLGGKNGLQSPSYHSLGSAPSSVAIGDVNGDGKADVVLAAPDRNSDGYYTGTGTVDVSLGGGDGTFGSGGSYVIPSVPSSVALGDMNGDGRIDIVTAGSEANSVSLLMGDGDGTFGLAQSYAAGTTYTASAVVVGDFNGDHRPDLAVTDDSTYWGYYNSGGTSSVSVLLNAGDWSNSHFVVSGFPTSTTAGAASSFTVTVKKANGTTDTGYSGTVHFVSTDPQVSLPADYTFTAADQGTHTFSAALKTVGTQNLWATDSQAGAVAGGETGIAVQPGAASTFRFPYCLVDAPYGTTLRFTVTAYDAYGNLATGYNGTVHFTSTDPVAVLPPDAALSNGSGQFSVTMNTAGNQLLDATDVANPNLTSECNVPVAPAVAISGPYFGLVNQPLTFTLLGSGAPAGADYTFYLDWVDSSGGQIAAQTVTGPSGTTATLADTSTLWWQYGSTTLSVEAFYGNVPSATVSQSVFVLDSTATVEADPADSTKQMLVLDTTHYNGSLGNPFNIVLAAGANNSVTVTFSGSSPSSDSTTFTTSDGSPFALVELLGSPFGNVIDARGLSVSTVLVGGSVNDVLYGGSGRNLLIGGQGADTLYAGSAGDILIGGATSYDADPTALAFVMAEWDRTDVDYATRVNHLNGSLGGGLNGSYLLNSTTITDDATIDVLNGGAGLVWYIGHFNGVTQDQVTGQSSGEVLTSI